VPCAFICRIRHEMSCNKNRIYFCVCHAIQHLAKMSDCVKTPLWSIFDPNICYNIFGWFFGHKFSTDYVFYFLKFQYVQIDDEINDLGILTIFFSKWLLLDMEVHATAQASACIHFKWKLWLEEKIGSYLWLILIGKSWPESITHSGANWTRFLQF
jgi:hypothetical protein